MRPCTCTLKIVGEQAVFGKDSKELTKIVSRSESVIVKVLVLVIVTYFVLSLLTKLSEHTTDGDAGARVGRTVGFAVVGRAEGLPGRTVGMFVVGIAVIGRPVGVVVLVAGKAIGWVGLVVVGAAEGAPGRTVGPFVVGIEVPGLPVCASELVGRVIGCVGFALVGVAEGVPGVTVGSPVAGKEIGVVTGGLAAEWAGATVREWDIGAPETAPVGEDGA